MKINCWVAVPAALVITTAAHAQGSVVDFLFKVPTPQVNGQQVERDAPNLIIWLDASGSSPIYDAAFMRQAVKVIEPQILALPLGAEVICYTAGDATRLAKMWRTRIQARTSASGMAADAAARRVRAILSGFSSSDAEGSSALLGTIFDAAQLLNVHAKSPNIIIGISDLIERSANADCLERACTLPAPGFTVRKDTIIKIYGVAARMNDAKARSIEAAWRRYLTAANFGTIALRRKF